MVYTTITPEHLALIERIARRLIQRLPPHVTTVDDLVNIGYLGYRDACERYDPERGIRFATFAERRIRGAMLDALRQADVLKRERRSLKNRRDAADMVLTDRLGRPPTCEEVAAYLGVAEDVIEAIDRIPSSPELIMDHTDRNGILAEIQDEEASGRNAFDHCAVREVLRHIESALVRLSPREVFVLHARYVQGLNQREIADLLEVTPGRVCQLEWRAIAKLRVACETPVVMAA